MGFAISSPKLSQEKKAMGIGSKFLGTLAATFVASVAFTTPPASAGNIHTLCVSPTPACMDNNQITPVVDNTPNFGFQEKGGSDTGNFYLDVLIPNNVLNAD